MRNILRSKPVTCAQRNTEADQPSGSEQAAGEDLATKMGKAAEALDKLKSSFVNALVEEAAERAARMEQQEETEYLGLKIPQSMMQQLDSQRMAGVGVTRSEYARSALQIYLRMGGLRGKMLQQELDAILDEAMGDRFGQAIERALLVLGPEVTQKILDFVKVFIFGTISKSLKVPSERVAEKIMAALQELKEEGESASEHE